MGTDAGFWCYFKPIRQADKRTWQSSEDSQMVRQSAKGPNMVKARVVNNKYNKYIKNIKITGQNRQRIKVDDVIGLMLEHDKIEVWDISGT